MEITAEILFWALIGCSALIVILQGVSISKNNQLQQSLSDESTNTVQILENYATLTKSQLEDQKNIIESNLQKLSDKLMQQAALIIAGQTSVSQNSSQYHEQTRGLVTDSISEVKAVIASNQNLSVQYQDSVMKASEALKQAHNDSFAALTASHKKQAKDLLDALSEAEARQSLAITSLNAYQSEQFALRQKQLEQVHVAINERLTGLKQLGERSEFAGKQSSRAMLEQLTAQIQRLRADNLVSLTNELAQHQDLKLVTDDFIKTLGECKVTHIEDKHSGQMTNIYYEQNIKRRSDTFAGELLKYQMLFNKDGKPSVGREFDTMGNLVFEYTYDDAGEISKRVETTYDCSGQQSSQSEVAY
ncbi:chemotaxis protein [Vibrio sp. YMD68]|uniref:chemotaxis protein n=1 Tax=Vibrio sp. YMD68 TaxID=3042300 RepID=UPI00249AF43F|nr:chemotaxis protein [Vibrio sp. YMD68]WGV98563.1 chemotaxis protein [Vibrio sp. YMD68]